MAYGLRYTADFDGIGNGVIFYQLNIYKKNYSGSPQTIILNAEPAVQEWQDDDPHKAIKGCTLTIGIINDGTISLEDFYSTDDNEYYVELKRTSTDMLLFAGYVLQDDCEEIMVDYAHEIKIVATDNLGLLKNVTFDQAAKFQGPSSTETNILIGEFTTFQFLSNDTRIAEFAPGLNFEILNGAYAGTYRVENITFNTGTGFWTITVNNPIPSAVSYFADISWNDDFPISSYMSLLQVTKLCLKATRLDLPMTCFSTLYPENGSTGRWLDDTYINGESFFVDGKWLNCYEILEKIYDRFRGTLFQSIGKWYIVRWSENYKISNNSPNANELYGHNYDPDFTYLNSTYQDYLFSFGNNSFSSAVLKSITRPVQEIVETFKYGQYDRLLRNEDLQELGDLIRTYASGANTIYEYELPYWSYVGGTPTPPGEKFIRVIKDPFNIDVDRYIVMKQDNQTAVVSTIAVCDPIIVSEGDMLDYSFDWRSDIFYTQPFAIWFEFIIRVVTATDTWFLDINSRWTNNPADDPFRFFFFDPTNNGWKTVNALAGNPIPAGGKLEVFLYSFKVANAAEWWYKNFKMNITNNVSGQVFIEAHVHTASQVIETNKTTDKEIFIDNSPRPSINGTLFIDQQVNGIYQNANAWIIYVDGSTISFFNLGNLVTREQMFENYIPRRQYNGTLLFVTDKDRILSNLAILQNTTPSWENDNYLIFGSLSINYKQNTCDFTLYENADYDSDIKYNPAAAFTDFFAERQYNFEYIYKKRD
jgi:hypothetical protein